MIHYTQLFYLINIYRKYISFVHVFLFIMNICKMFQLVELKMSLEGLEKERDFYFGKLRDIEVMCQDCDNGGDPPPIVQKILEVLYATEVIYFNLF